MRIEIDISLKNPLDTIDLRTVYEVLNDEIYKVICYKSGNYILIELASNQFSIRLHEDGRIYIKTNTSYTNALSKNSLLIRMLHELTRFICRVNLLDKFDIRSEINFSFHDNKARSFFWIKYDEINHIGKNIFGTYNLRTYTNDENSIYIKLDSFVPLSIDALAAAV